MELDHISFRMYNICPFISLTATFRFLLDFADLFRSLRKDLLQLVLAFKAVMDKF